MKRGQYKFKDSALTKSIAVLLVGSNVFLPFVALAQEAIDTLPPPPPAETAPTDTTPQFDTTLPEASNSASTDAPFILSDSIITDTSGQPAAVAGDPSTPLDTATDPAAALDSPATDKSNADAANLDGAEMMAMGAGAGNTSPTIPGPNVLTMQSVQPRVDGNTGALTFRIPLDIPPGRNGMQPDLALVYNSQSTQDGLVGYGWDVSIPSIVRVNKTGSQNLYTGGAFSSTLDGELATTSTSTPNLYRARVDESRRTYSFASNTWTVYDKNGTRYLFGSASQSQLAATTSPSNVYRWYLDEIRDTNNNYVRFTYTRDGNQLYPSQIIYTGNVVTDGVFTVDFSLVSRPDPVVDYRPGFRVTTNSRISQITAKMNGTMMRQYMLAYTSGNNATRSLLQSIQVTGQNDAGQQVTLPALTFNYVSASTPFIQQKSIVGPAWIPTDVNGNGTADVSVFWQSVNNNSLNADIAIDPLSSAPGAVTPPEYWAVNSNDPDPRPARERGTRFLDIDADGKADIVRGFYDYTNATATNAIYANTYATTTGAYSWTSTTTGVTSVPNIDYDGSASIHNMSTGVFADVNADGLPDFAQRVDGYYSAKAHLGDGHAWTATTTVFAPPKTFPSTAPLVYNSQLVDINGDGLSDWVYSDNGQTFALLNNGSGWNANPDPQWTIATTTLYYNPTDTNYYDRGIRFLDINGDGLPDFLHSYSAPVINQNFAPMPERATYNDVFLNTGNGWATSTAYTLGTITAPHAPSGVYNGITLYNEYANFDGNGQHQQDVISTVTYPRGGSTTVTYATSSSMVANRELPYSFLVVTSLVNHDGYSSNEATTYSYSGGKQHRPWYLPDRKFAGFASTTITTPTSITTTYYNQNDGVNAALGEQSDGYAHINRPFREDISTTAGTLLRKTLRKWETITHGAVDFIAATRELIQDFASDGTHRDRSTEYTYATSTDDLLQIADYGEVTGNTDGTYTDIGSDLRATAYSYVASTSINLSRPTEKKILLGSATTTGPSSAPVVALIIGGGGGGGFDSGGGGGAGGYQYNASLSVSPQAYSVTVGAGGAGASAYNDVTGGNGSNSNFATITATGGGRGGNYWNNGAGNNAGGNGGSGGGSQSNGAAGTGSQGSNGGVGSGAGGAGGGGGASAAGANNSGATAGAGGAGTTNSITGTSITYAGGGGGGSGTAGAGGAGGTGGGGAGAGGSSGTAGTNGTANTGGGGGGGSAGSGWGGNGGAGVVVISYPTGSLTATGGTISTTSTNTIHKFTSSGTFTVSALGGGSTTTVFSTVVAHQKYYYDTLAWGSIGKGNQTRQDDLKSGTSYASSTIDYNTYGLATSTTDRNGKRTNYTFDAYSLYPTTVTNPLSQATQYTYNYSNGQVVQTTDPNARLSKKLYDGVGRIIEQQQSDLTTPATLVTAATFTYTDNSSPPSSVKQSVFLTATTSVDTYSYFDGLNRLRQERKQNNAGSYTASDRTYDSSGRLYQFSLPYFSSGTSFTSPTTTSSLLTTFSYDALNRVTSSVNAVGTTATSYSKWTEAITDANNHIKDFVKDAFGNLAQVVEHASSNYTTTYSYDVLGNLASTTDALGNIRSFTYDGLSRRLTAQDLHAPADATFGTYSYVYDDNGNLTSQTDPKSQITARTYDALNRVLTEDYTGAAGTEVTYTYDSCTYGIGSLCIASSTASKTSNAYDILGRVSVATTTIAGADYVTRTSYDRAGNTTSITLPNSSRLTYLYGAGGLTSSITRTSGATTTTMASVLAYQPTTQLGQLLFGNNASTTYTYDLISRLSRIMTKGAASTTMYLLPTNAKVLVVGGGGGGGNTYYGDGDTGGGGGGGGYQYNPAMQLSVGSYAVTIGSGGQSATDGAASIFNGTTANGGGHGAGQTGGTNGGNGGSGGGAAYYGAAGTGSQGSNGGSGSGATYGSGGGGGGSAVGSNASSYNGGNGGAGIANTITGTTTYYAGGGGGGGVNVAGIGGTGGGGNGGTNINRTGSPGINGLGGGGGGATCNLCFTYYNGGRGGDGVVVISYPTGSLTATGGTITTSGTSTIHTFTASSTFTITASNNIATTTEPEKVVDLTYTYDPVGNILTRVDNSHFVGGQTTTYSYDNLDRLLTASTTGFTSYAPLYTSFAYDALGNITSTTGTTTTTYTYAQTGYTNPHAPTSIAGVSYTYDNNGNLTTQGSKSFTWDYANRITQSVGSGATTTYGYDFAGSRMFQTVGSTTTRYPSRNYSIVSTTNGATTTATSTEYIFLGDLLVATVDQGLVNGTATGSPTTSYVHADHLGSTAAVTNASGTPVQRLDYLPYGATRVSAGSTIEKRQYIGEFTDTSGLSYLNARYYDSARGQFTSQDPVFWEIGLSRDGKNALANPQALNSYAYANDNPLVNKDPSGRCPVCVLGAAGGAVYGVSQQMAFDSTSGQSASVPAYVWAGLKGAVQGALLGGALAVSGPTTILRAYGNFDTAKNLYEYSDQLVLNPVGSNPAQQRMTASLTYLDLFARITSFYTPAQVAEKYEAIRGVLDAVLKLSQQLPQNNRNNSVAPAPTPSPKTTSPSPTQTKPTPGANNGGWGSTRTACGTLCS